MTSEKITPESSWETIKSMNLASFPYGIINLPNDYEGDFVYAPAGGTVEISNIFDTDIETSAYGYYTPNYSDSWSAVYLCLNFGVSKVVKYMYILATVPENYISYNSVEFVNIDDDFKSYDNILNDYAGNSVFLEIPIDESEPIVSLPIMEDYPLS